MQLVRVLQAFRSKLSPVTCAIVLLRSRAPEQLSSRKPEKELAMLQSSANQNLSENAETTVNSTVLEESASPTRTRADISSFEPLFLKDSKKRSAEELIKIVTNPNSPERVWRKAFKELNKIQKLDEISKKSGAFKKTCSLLGSALLFLLILSFLFASFICK